MWSRGCICRYLILFTLASFSTKSATAQTPSTPSPYGAPQPSEAPNCGVVKLLLATLTPATPEQPWLATRGKGEAFLMFINQCNGTDLLLVSINVTAVPDATHIQLRQGGVDNETGQVVIDFERVLQEPQWKASRFASMTMNVNSSLVAPLVPSRPNGVFYDYYMVVVTPQFPNGAVRGQVYNFPVNGEFSCNEGEVFSELAGGNVLPTPGAPEGAGFFKLAFKDNKNGFVSISYSVILHAVPLAFSATIREGQEGVIGSVVVNFGEGQTFSRFGREGDTLLYGNMQIPTSLAFRLFYSPRSFYVLIQSAFFPQGAVRGQLVMPRPVHQNFTFVAAPQASPSSSSRTRQRPPLAAWMPLLLCKASLLWGIYFHPTLTTILLV